MTTKNNNSADKINKTKSNMKTKTKGADINQINANMTTNYNEFLGFKINSELKNTLEETLIKRVIESVQIFQELLLENQIKRESLTEYLSSNSIPGIGNFEKALNIQRGKFIVDPEDSLDETLVLAIMVYVEEYQQRLETACDEDSIYSKPKTPASTGVMSANI